MRNLAVMLALAALSSGALLTCSSARRTTGAERSIGSSTMTQDGAIILDLRAEGPRFSLPGGYTLMFTGMKVLNHDGSQHHGVGIRPTIPVSRTRAGVAAGRDELLERALLAVNN